MNHRRFSTSRRLPFSLLGAGLLALAGCGADGLPTDTPSESLSPAAAADLRALERASLVEARIALADAGTHATSIQGRFGTTEREPVAAARAFLEAHAELLALDRGTSDLALLAQTDDVGGAVLRFEQRVGDIPVALASVVVGLAPDGAIVHVTNEHVARLDVPTTPVLSEDDARHLAGESLGTDASGAAVRLVIVQGDETSPGHHLAFEVPVVVDAPREEHLVFVDALSGVVVRDLDTLKHAGPVCVPCDPSADFGCASVFFPGPVERADDPSLRDSHNVDAHQIPCQLHNLTSGTNLTGSWVNTSLTPSRIGPPYNQLRSANQNAVDETTVYYAANNAKEYLDQLGFPSVMAFSINTNAHDIATGDNAYYSPQGKYMVFGTGGTDDGQDPDVISHEYGHALQDNQVPGYGSSVEGGSTGEGFGDYWAAAITDGFFATALGAPCVGSWDATAYLPYTGAPGTGCLRRVDGVEQYPKDLHFEVHDDGEIWSAALWNLRSQLGATTTDTLVIKAHTYLTATAGFRNAADGLISADQALYAGANTAVIDATMKAFGIPRSGTAAAVTTANPKFITTCQTAHPYANGTYLECKYTQPGATRIRFRFTKFQTATGDAVYISDANYKQVQVMQGTLFAGAGGASSTVTGDTIVARFKANNSGTAWGFSIGGVNYQ
jgi:Zn-dependent metalloprotease